MRNDEVAICDVADSFLQQQLAQKRSPILHRTAIRNPYASRKTNSWRKANLAHRMPRSWVSQNRAKNSPIGFISKSTGPSMRTCTNAGATLPKRADNPDRSF